MLFDSLFNSQKKFKTETLVNYIIVIGFISIFLIFYAAIHKTGGSTYWQMQAYERKFEGLRSRIDLLSDIEEQRVRK